MSLKTALKTIQERCLYFLEYFFNAVLRDKSITMMKNNLNTHTFRRKQQVSTNTTPMEKSHVDTSLDTREMYI